MCGKAFELSACISAGGTFISLDGYLSNKAQTPKMNFQMNPPNIYICPGGYNCKKNRLKQL